MSDDKNKELPSLLRIDPDGTTTILPVGTPIREALNAEFIVEDDCLTEVDGGLAKMYSDDDAWTKALKYNAKATQMREEAARARGERLTDAIHGPVVIEIPAKDA